MHYNIPEYLSKDIGKIQFRAMNTEFSICNCSIDTRENNVFAQNVIGRVIEKIGCVPERRFPAFWGHYSRIFGRGDVTDFGALVEFDRK